MAMIFRSLAPLSLLAAPYIPVDDAQVLETLPTQTGDPAVQELRALRDALARDPGNPDRSVELAQRYFDVASAAGEPRYIGYAEAVIRPWSETASWPIKINF